jgi:adenylate cyclase
MEDPVFPMWDTRTIAQSAARRDRRYVVTVEVVERPAAERPINESLDAVAEWMVGAAREIPSGLWAFDEFAWRMLATGLPLLQVTLHFGALHPQFLGGAFIWWRTSGQTEHILIPHEASDVLPYEDNPVQRVWMGGETLRRRLDVPDETLDFAVLRELKAQSATDYLALPIRTVHGPNRYVMVTYVTDRPGGFTADEIADITRVSQRLGIPCDIQALRWVALNVLNAYLGPKTGPRVLAGQIRRGTGEELTAVLWSSDLRGFTERSDRLPGDRMIAILNALFEAQVQAIHDHGGEILKFIGDGLLAIFPIEDGATADRAATNALEAAQQALAAVRRLNAEPSMADEPPLEIVVALHVGTVIYGNIGAAQRLDFIVIGPAVNLLSRLEAKAKTLSTAIVLSDDFARTYERPLISLGHHPLRGLAQRRELFAPPLITQAAPASL